MSEERAVLVGAGEPRYMAELGRLATTLGMEVAGVLEQGRRDGTGYLGRGKREELRGLVEEVEARFVVADDELTASQARVLERAAGVSVVDRTELIIRIFEAHARDAASRLEVELADLEYRLPRVKGRNPELSRLGGGGVTTRGPGEQQLEYDRRAIRRRMDTINRKAEEGGSAHSGPRRLHERREDDHPERAEWGGEVYEGQALRDPRDHHPTGRRGKQGRARRRGAA
jgi:GTP-binding protein HflX